VKLRFRWRRSLGVAVCAVALASWACIGDGGDGDDGVGSAATTAVATKRWVLSNVHTSGYPTPRGLVRFAERVEAEPLLSKRIDVDLQLGGVLGNEKETLEKLRFGALQAVCSSTAPLAEFAESIGVLSLPYLFRDAEHMWAVLEGEVGRQLSADLMGAGFVALAWYDAGARSFYNRRRPVRRLEDLAGLKIRVQRSEIMHDTVAALGASPAALGFKQVYTSLHTGAIDGAENNLPSYRSERHFEAAPFYSLDRHSMIPDVLLVARKDWESLSSEEQEAVRRAGRESALEQRRFWEEYVEEAREMVLEAGSEIHEIEDPEAFRRAVRPVYEKHAERYGDLVERIRAVM